MRSSCSGNCWGDIDISTFNGQLKSEPVKHCSCLMPVEHLKWDALGGTQCVPAGGFVLATNWQWHWPQGSWALLSLRHLLIHRRNSSLWGWEALEQAAQSIIPGSVWGQVGLLLSEEQLWPSPTWMWPHGSKSSPWCAVNFVPFLPFLAPALCGQQLWGGHTAGSIPWAGLGKAEDGVCCRIDWSAAVLEFFC